MASTVFLPDAEHAAFGQNTDMLKVILARVQDRLKACDLTESEASKKAGMSDSTIRNWRRELERDPDTVTQPNTKTLQKLAPVLGVSLMWLLQGGELDSAITATPERDTGKPEADERHDRSREIADLMADLLRARPEVQGRAIKLLRSTLYGHLDKSRAIKTKQSS